MIEGVDPPMKPTNLAHRSLCGLLASLGFLTLSLIGFSARQVQRPAPTKDQIAFFEKKIRPVLVDNCYGCHGSKSHMGGLRVDSIADLLKGGGSGPAIVPGEPNKSLLMIAVRQSGLLKMPQGGKLSPSEVADIEAWVQMGAPWPGGSQSKAAEPEKLWSLQPVRKQPMPKVKRGAWVQNPIDAFVLAKLEARKLDPAAPADRLTLIRRVTYDLTGLPPTVGETEAFLADRSPKAYENVVDRLLASPRYGERWARHWLDVARYADSKGYVFNEDRNYPNAYTYRQWVINAFNRDLPYDRFIAQQLAADLLPEVINGDDKTPLAALGFLTIGRRFLNSQPDIIDDRIDVTMRGFEGFTVECARCHDHKFDPIPTQDYYSLYSVFASSVEKASPISEKSIREPWERYTQKMEATEASVREIVSAQVNRLRALTKDPGDSKPIGAEIKQALQSFREEEAPDAATLARLRPAFEPEQRDRLAGLQTELDSLKKNPPPTPELAMAMIDGPKPSDGVVFKRGNPGNRGEVAPRRFLLALSKPGVERDHWTSGSGRLELAKAIASRDNPLTARVLVNRVWQDHFGAGIVRTPSDFGHQGERPTHPELLDYLATTFMDSGWSIKKLQKLIVMSATYRQSSSASEQVVNADPENRLLGRMNRRRLDMEQMRDTLMDVAGRLDLSQLGGKSVDLWARPFTNRRAVYGFVERQNLPGTFRTFDFASPDSTSAKRFLTTVPQQALFFMNSPLCVEDAEALAQRREVVQATDDAQRIRRLYLLVYQRLPDAEEMSAGVAYLRRGEPRVNSPASVWRYGSAEFDEAQGRVSYFTPFAQFDGVGYHVGSAFPDPTLGYLVLNAQGGHPGHDRKHCVVRRWVAPATMTVHIQGTVRHAQAQGDGIGARIVSSRHGVLGRWEIHNGSAIAELAAVPVERGDTLDFVVDPLTNDGFDSFSWAPRIVSADGRLTWDAAADFGPPPGPPISRLALYAQALMMTNEFIFVD
jgi:hypothetical protein